jgi:hypothetical protein
MEEHDGRLSGRFLIKHGFNIADQIHTLTSKRISTKDYELVVSQPGGNVLRFNPNEENGENNRSIDLIMIRIFIFRTNCSNRYVQLCNNRMDRSNST